MKIFTQSLKFQWDKGNTGKNIKHKVEDKKAEEPFFDKNKVIYKDILHSQREGRYILIGKTKENRLLYTVFTIRGENVRIISSRDINKKEKQMYEKST